MHKPTISNYSKAIQFVLFFIFLLCGEFLHAGENSGKVIKVTDGDSINILYEGKPLRIQLEEIDVAGVWKLPENERMKRWEWRKRKKADKIPDEEK